MNKVSGSANMKTGAKKPPLLIHYSVRRNAWRTLKQNHAIHGVRNGG